MNQAKVTQLASDGTEMKEGTMWNGEQQQLWLRVAYVA